MDIKAVISQMTLEEKAGLCSGLDFWHTKPVERLGVVPGPAVNIKRSPLCGRYVETGEFTIEAGQSSRAIDVSGTVTVTGTVNRNGGIDP